ncbi:hypothetical protein [Legionella rowbothamii]|uniref:hypothetical protein n=1 Tax=Legionella rowbothamii TaxID=96229 RepID=UPI0010544D32|nr:hypothetical protein [Legionella rowbothamii]
MHRSIHEQRFCCKHNGRYFLATSALAGTMRPITTQRTWTWVGSFSADPVWEGAGNTQTFYLTTDIEKTYVAHKSSNALFDGEVFWAHKKHSPKPCKAN